MLPIVSIVGRPNVGKSTLFNCLSKTRKAIVHDLPGVTRDRIYEKAVINDKHYLLVDTGGLIFEEEEKLEKLVKSQALIAIEESDVILAVLDIKAGLTPLDKELIDFLRKKNKKYFIILNKADTEKDDKLLPEFFELGEDNLFLLSAAQRRNTNQLEKTIYLSIPKIDISNDDNFIKIGLLGRPNVGKSSLVNKILGYERVIVSDIPGTTRDSVDSVFQYNNKNFTIIDTAGIRRKSKINYKLERISVIRSIATIERSDVLLLMHDATEGITHQDKALANLINAKGKGIIILFNKWDKFKDKKLDEKKYMALVKKDLQFVNYAPILKISALTGLNIKKILQLVEKIYTNQKIRIQTSYLNQFLDFVLKKHAPPSFKGKQVKIKYMTQVDTNPPKFIFFCNRPEGIKDSYKKYMQNQIRKYFDFEGVPIKFFFKNK